MNILEIQDGVYLAKCYDCNEPIIVYMSKEFIKDGMSFTCGECRLPQINKNRGIARPILWGGYKIKQAINKDNENTYMRGYVDGYKDGYTNVFQQMIQQKISKEVSEILDFITKDTNNNMSTST